MNYEGVEKDEYSDRPIEFLRRFLPIDKFDKYLSEHKKLLDIGSGIGNMVEYYSKLGHDTIGVTYQEEEVKTAKNLNRNVVLGDAHELPFEDNSFDGILMIDCLEHCVAPLIALREIKRVLKNGGKGIIYIPSEDWISCDYHIIVPNLAQMLQLFKLAGIDVEDIKFIYDSSIVYYISVSK